MTAENSVLSAVNKKEQIADINSKPAKYWEDLALIESQKSNLNLAKQYMENAFQLSPKNLIIKENIANLTAQMGDYSQAIKMFDEILDIQPEFVNAFENLGRTLIIWAKKYDIKGWFTIREAAQIYRLTKSLKSENPVIVELGSCFGQSSMILAHALKNKPKAKIYCIDAWEDDGSTVDGITRNCVQGLEKHDFTFHSLYINLMTKAGVINQLTPIKGFTTEIVKNWKEQADIIFVDADHSYQGVRADVRDWKNWVKPKGQLLMHDVDLVIAGAEKDSGPGKVVQEFLGIDSDFKDGQLMDTLYSTTKIS